MIGLRAGGCLSDDRLLRLSSGELTPRGTRAAERHLEGCPVCRERMSRFAVVFDAYRAHLPADENSRNPDGAGRLTRLMLAESPASHRAARPRLRRGVAAAAVGMVTLALLLWSRQGEITLNAETLIARAVESEESQSGRLNDVITIALAPTPCSALPARVGDPELVRHGARPISEQGHTARELARRLAGHSFDWRTPLSARPFQHWRRTSTIPVRDSLEWLDGSLVRVSSSAAAGEIRSAELTLDFPTYRPVAQIWRFADGFEVELRRVPDLLRLPSVPTQPAAVARHEAAVPATAPAGARGLPEIELEARVALEHLGIPLGRDLSLRRARGLVSVEGVAARARLAAIRAETKHLDRVVVRLSEPGTTLEVTTAPLSLGLAAWLSRTFGSSALRATFVERSRELRTRLEDASGALGELGRRYPSDVAASLPATARASLDDLVQAYYRRVISSFEALELHLAPLTGTLSRRLFDSRAPERWRELPTRLGPALDDLEAALEGVCDPSLSSPEQVDDRGQKALRDALTALASVTTR